MNDENNIVVVCYSDFSFQTSGDPQHSPTYTNIGTPTHTNTHDLQVTHSER